MSYTVLLLIFAVGLICFFLILKKVLFIVGCAGSLLSLVGFLQLQYKALSLWWLLLFQSFQCFQNAILLQSSASSAHLHTGDLVKVQFLIQQVQGGPRVSTSDRIPGGAGDAGPLMVRRSKALQDASTETACFEDYFLMMGRNSTASGFQCYLNIAVKADFICNLISMLLKYQKESLLSPFQNLHYRNVNIQKKFYLLK